ncbi:HlyD family type I secretion periplasmic adaptor subunit [Teredinibacter turnerae]|uniref:HlyD family type I secretion periplasmic adaptor subunit n=1 Tax=Teredinibacter turnerae TaxID=2426 RepID=UPI0030CF86FA
MLAIQTKPPEPLFRWVLYIVVCLFIFLVCWACIGEVDIVASAEGKIIPSSRVKVIQPLEKSVVREILVNEGDNVKKGETLIVLDQTQTGASYERVRSEYEDSRNRAFVRSAMLAWLNEFRGQNAHSDAPDYSLFWHGYLKSHTQPLRVPPTHFQWYLQRCMQYLAERDNYLKKELEIRAEQEVSSHIIIKLERSLPLLTEHADALRGLQNEKVVSRVQYLSVERERIQQVEELAAEKSRLQVYSKRLAELQTQIAIHTSKTKAELLDEIAVLQREIDSLHNESLKAGDLNNKQYLVAPVDGRVQQLMVSTIGGIVTPAQELMLIVPENDPLQVEVMLENKDVGFVSQNQRAEIKIHTFPFTKYGVLEAQVLNISGDAINDEKRGLIFPMRLRMEKRKIRVNGIDVDLKPGMGVTAEIKTGKRRLIEFFMYPLLRFQSESVRER